MNNSINLLIQSNKPKTAETKQLLWFRRVAIGSFAITLLCSLVLLLLVIFSPLASLNEQKTNLVNQLAATNEKITTLLGLDDRLKNISTVLALRPPYDNIMSILKDQVPGNSRVQTVQMSGKHVVFGIASESLGDLDTFLTNLETLNSGKTKLFRTLSLTSITYNSLQKYYVLTTDMNLL